MPLGPERWTPDGSEAVTQKSNLRVYVVFKKTDALLALYRRKDLRRLTEFTLRLIAVLLERRQDDSDQPPVELEPFIEGIEAIATPSLDWRAAFVGRRAVTTRAAVVVPRDIEPDELIIVYRVRDTALAHVFLRLTNEHRHIELDDEGNSFHGSGSDPGAAVADHWCPGQARSAIFGHRSQARRTVHADALRERSLRGQSVNVVIIDEGLDKDQIPPKNWGGGLDHYIDMDLVLPAGSAPPRSHGMMIARSILDLAPDARLFDVPAVPVTTAPNVQVFISTLQAAYESLLQEIVARRGLTEPPECWVLVNAWGVFDTSSDPTGSYVRNTEIGGHPMINLVTRAVETDRLDIIFSAGNCGEFCPEGLCGGRDRGPGHSIWGANAHPLVITAGAVRADETWLGYSSQGPGPELLAAEKPDVCAPSQFCETYDARLLSSGTSAACAMTAGVVAALRSGVGCGQDSLTPAELKAALIKNARKPNGAPDWDHRMGGGIVDAREAMAVLGI